MPLSTRNRFRSKLSSARRISTRGIGLSALASLVPKAMILPIIILAGITAASAAFWTYDIHIEQAYGEVDDAIEADTVDAAN
jgi:hypothetical protein